MKTVLIIGGGPAGLTAAYELGKTGKFHVVVLEKEKQLGGISRTLMYQGNRIDIGGHRFFSKSRVVMDWWKTCSLCKELHLVMILLSNGGLP